MPWNRCEETSFLTNNYGQNERENYYKKIRRLWTESFLLLYLSRLDLHVKVALRHCSFILCQEHELRVGVMGFLNVVSNRIVM
jgi:hypothetical protein